MVGYTIRRIIQSIVVVLGVLVIMFILQSLLPDPARAIVGVHASPAVVHAFIVQNDLNKPFYIQLWHYLYEIIWKRSLGRSYKLNESVGSIIDRDAPKSLLLVGVALLISIIVAVPIGIFQAVRRNKASDQVVTGVSFILYAMPTFFLGI
jgi:peptide/nickel transport system permease protein